MDLKGTASDIISEFVSRFRREFDFYEQAGRIVAQRIETQLESSGVRAMVTSRAKNPKRLEVKVRQRDSERDVKYQSVEEIYADIVDLAGVRVALYFPGEREEVDKIIKEIFHLPAVPKIFTGTSIPDFKKRFSGYWATHYRVRLREDSLTEQTLRFADARVEVQVASVLMHAWSEVEHDLVYKPMQGALSEDELAILDELNGMVLTGEIALERLQRAAKIRVSTAGSRFENHYDLASFLLELGKLKRKDSDKEPVVGDVEILFRLLSELNISTPEALSPYIQGLTADSEQRPLSQQIVDQILASDPQRYAAYATIRSDSQIGEQSPSVESKLPVPVDPAPDAIGHFMKQWIIFERFLREIAVSRGLARNVTLSPTRKFLSSLNIFTDEEIQQVERMRMLRNELVHGVRNRAPVLLRNEGDVLAKIMSRLKDGVDNEASRAVERAAADLPFVEQIISKFASTESGHTRFELSEDAVTLLRAAAEDKQGQILKLMFLDGAAIQAGTKQFGMDSAKEFSRWGAALNELLAEKLVEVNGHKGELFSLTHPGWLMAEKLGAAPEHH